MQLVKDINFKNYKKKTLQRTITKRVKITRSFSKPTKNLAESKLKQYVTQSPIE